jgi:hypothetical protein
MTKKLTIKADKFLFFDESGTGGDNIYLALGVIVCIDPAEIHQKLEAVRNKKSYHNEIKFEKMSSRRFVVCRQFLKVFAAENVFFRAVLINKKDVGIEHFDYKDWARFNLLAADLLNSVIHSGEISQIYADEKTSPAEDNFSEYLITHVAGVDQIVLVDSKAYDLIQLCDLLLGGIRAKLEGVVKNSEKKKLIKEISRFSARKLSYYEYKLKFGQPSKTESGRNS